MEIENKISLLKVFRKCLEEKRFIKKYLGDSLSAIAFFNLDIVEGETITLIPCKDKTRIWFMGIIQDYPAELGEELIKLFDNTHLEKEHTTKGHEEWLYKNFADCIE